MDASEQVVEGCDIGDLPTPFTNATDVFSNITPDPCGTLVLIHNDVPSGGLCPDGLTVVRTYTLFDDLNNDQTLDGGEESEVCVEVFRIRDTTDPEINCPADVTVECNTDIIWDESTAMDNCDDSPVIEVVSTISNLDNNGKGTVTRTWRATDCAGNTDECSQTITVEDTTAPVITCPADVTIECGDPTDTSVTGIATATDNCGVPSVEPVDSSVPGCGNTETITRTWTATDINEQSNSCIQTITVEDTTPPVISGVPATSPDICCDEELPTPGDFNPIVIDGCGSASIVFSSKVEPHPGGALITYVWTATDDCGNTAEETTSFVFLSVVEGTCPDLDQQVSCPAEIPCPDDEETLSYFIEAITESFEGTYGTVEVSLESVDPFVSCSDDESEGSGTFSQTFYFKVVNLCNGEIVSICPVTFYGECSYCTFTQGFWGNAGGYFPDKDDDNDYEECCSGEFEFVEVDCSQIDCDDGDDCTDDWCDPLTGECHHTPIFGCGVSEVTTDCSANNDPHPSPGDEEEYRSYYIEFSDGTILRGTIVDEKKLDVEFGDHSMRLHISCSEEFIGPDRERGTADDGYGEKEGPYTDEGHPRVVLYSFWRYDEDNEYKECCANAPKPVQGSHHAKVDNNALNVALRKTIALYPNPSHDEIYLDLSAYQGMMARFTIVNAMGEFVWHERVDEVTASPVKFNLELPGGLYYIRVNIGGVVIHKPFILVED